MSALWPGTRTKSATLNENGNLGALSRWSILYDSPSNAAPSSVLPGDRVWIEAVREGQVVGVLDMVVERDGWKPSDIQQSMSRFSEVALSSFRTVGDDQLPKATVVVPTICESSEELVRTVSSLLALDYPDFEILVVDNRMNDDHGPLPVSPQTIAFERLRSAHAALPPHATKEYRWPRARSWPSLTMMLWSIATGCGRWGRESPSTKRSRASVGWSCQWSSSRHLSFGSKSSTAASVRRLSAPP